MNDGCNWTKTHIGTACVVGDGVHASISRQETGVQYLTSKNFKSDGLDLSRVDYISEEDFQRHFRSHSKALTRPEPGDVLLSIIGSVGEPYLVRSQDRFGLSSSVAILRPNRSVLYPKYLYYWMRASAFQNALYGIKGGVAQSYLSLEMIRSLPLEYPSVSHQHQIAGLLSAYDDLIENNMRRIAILEEMAQALYREWFVHFRFPGHEDVALVESPLGPIPEEWEATNLRAVSSYINRGVSPKYDNRSMNVVINQKCIRDHSLNLELARLHSTNVPPDKYVQFGDVLVNSTGIGTLGRVAQIYTRLTNCTVDSHVSIVRSSDRVNLDYFGMNLFTLQPYFDSRGAGSTGQTELSREAIGSADFVLPPKPIQDSFGQLVSPIRSSTSLMAVRNVNLRRTRDLLLPKLISGEIDVQALMVEWKELVS